MRKRERERMGENLYVVLPHRDASMDDPLKKHEYWRPQHKVCNAKQWKSLEGDNCKSVTDHSKGKNPWNNEHPYLLSNSNLCHQGGKWH